VEDNRIDPTLAFMTDDYQPTPEEVVAQLELKQKKQMDAVFTKVESILNNCCDTSLELVDYEGANDTLRELKDYLEQVLEWL